MTISEFEQHRCESLLKDFCEKQGPPPHLYHQLKWGFEVDPETQVVELFEIRPHFMESSRKIQSPIAKAKYVKAQANWKIYWMRGTGKWVLYEPCPSVHTFETFLDLLKDDEYGCFFG